MYGSSRSYVITVLNALTFAATPAMNAASRPATARPSIPFGKYWPISSGIALLYWRSGSLPPRPLIEATAIMPGMIVMAGASSFGNAPISGVRRGREARRAQRALDLGEVRRPVAERLHEAEAEDDRDPVRADGVRRVRDRQALPRVRRALAELALRDRVGEAVPAAERLEADDRHRHDGDDDHEELEHLVVDRRRQAAERDVDEYDRGGDDDADEDRPAEHQLQHEGERVEVHAGDEDRRDGECDRVEQVRGLVEAPAQVLRDAAHLRAVVEGHHHEPEEDHRRDRADPVEVHARDAVLRTVRRLPDQ